MELTSTEPTVELAKASDIPLVIHHDDHEHLCAWPERWPVPRWGEGFHFQEEDFVITDSEWRLENIEIEDTQPGVGNVVLSYHIYIEEADLVDKDAMKPGRFS